MILLNKHRAGNFTSSQVHRLMGQPAKAKTYIQECNFERQLGRPLGTEASTRPIAWGHLCEYRVFNDLLGTEYTLTSKATILHPEIECWAGSPEGLKGSNIVYDIKGLQLKAFCEIVEIIEKNDPELLKADFPDKYWQLVSNSCLLDVTHAELIVYCPYRSELDDIRKQCENLDDFDLQKQLYWIAGANDEEMAFIPDGGYYKNLNKILFEVPQSDKETLTNKILECEKLLIKRPIPQLA